MSFCIDDTRKKSMPKPKEFIRDGIISTDMIKDWLRTIYEIRFFEEKVYDLLGQNIVKGASYLYAGEETVAAGAVAAIERGDVINSTHRGHGHCGAIPASSCRRQERGQRTVPPESLEFHDGRANGQRDRLLQG